VLITDIVEKLILLL